VGTVQRPRDAATVLAVAYGGVGDVVADLDDDAGWKPTRCAGWCVRDLLFHLYADARRGLAALSTPVDPQVRVDRDWVTYWKDWHPGLGTRDDGLRMVRISASTFSSFAALRDLHAETAHATVARARAVDPPTVVSTQGHALTAEDLMLTLAVEAAVHHLDLVVGLDRPGPSEESLRVARRVVEGLLGTGSLPPDWDDVAAVLVGTGRLTPTADQAAELGDFAARLPAFG
jgi:uncharacterized protein (TIGR03083 family)